MFPTPPRRTAPRPHAPPKMRHWLLKNMRQRLPRFRRHLPRFAKPQKRGSVENEPCQNEAGSAASFHVKPRKRGRKRDRKRGMSPLRIGVETSKRGRACHGPKTRQPKRGRKRGRNEAGNEACLISWLIPGSFQQNPGSFWPASFWGLGKTRQVSPKTRQPLPHIL